MGDRDLRIVCVPSAESREDEDAVGGSRAEAAASERKSKMRDGKCGSS